MQLNEYKDLLDLYIPEGFGPDEEDYDYIIPDDFQTVIDQLPKNVYTKWGISQFVIIKDDWDMVAKIGFNGWHVWEDYSENTHFQPYNINYAQKSFHLYQEAQKRGIDPIFAEMVILGNAGDSTVYLQEKVKCDFASSWETGDCKRKFSDDSHDYVVMRRRVGRGAWRMFESDWLAQAIDYYGKELVENLMFFLEEYRIYDFHEGNYGYREDGTPVLIDWADFSEVA